MHKFVFICGHHRSGTSLLFKCLSDNPAVSGFHDTGVPEDEGMFLQTVYPSDLPHRKPGQFGFNPTSFITEKSSLATPQNAELLFQQWAKYWDISKTALLEKSPPNLIRTRFLQALFPDAYFVVLLRHPVAAALATQKWSKTTIPSLLEHWLICHERFDLDKKHLHRLRLIKYEDFVTDPQQTLNGISDFIGIERRALEQKVTANVNGEYFKQWEEFRRNSVYLNNEAYFGHILESRMMRFGYSLLDVHKNEIYA